MFYNFNLYTPTKIAFGKGKEAGVADLVQEFGGSRVLLVYGGKSAERSGLLHKIRDSLDASGLYHRELGGVVPNPHLGKVYEGIALAKEDHLDFMLAVGGGSVIDTAKAIAYGVAEPDYDVWELYTGARQAKSCAPVGVILTIAAAGSETSTGSVITDERNGSKRAYDDDLARPRFAIMNPELTVTLPDYQTESGCVDIMMHTLERYFTQGGNPEITDGIAHTILRVVMKNAKILHTDPTNYDARAEVMWAGSLSHNNLTGCGNMESDWSTHMLEHELGGMFDVTHGAGLAALWPSWARYVMDSNLHRFVSLAVNVLNVTPEDGMTEEEIAEKGIQAMEDFFRSVGMPTNLHELGLDVTPDQIEAMASSCEEASGGSMGSAKVLFKADMIKIYEMANRH